jgi:hypothetical protein
LLEADDAALRPAQHRPSDVEGRTRRGPSRDDERIRQWHAALEVDDLALDAAREIRRDDHEMLLQLVVVGGIGRQLGADREELALDPQDDRVPAAVLDQGAGGAQGRDRLIDRAVRLRTRIRLRDAPTVEQAGLSPIPGLRDDALSCDGDVLGSAATTHFLRPVLQDLAMAGERQRW